MVSDIRIRKSSHGYYWVEERRGDGSWLIIESFKERKEALLAAAEEKAGRAAWTRYQGHQGRVSWVFKGDWRLSIWHKHFIDLNQSFRSADRKRLRCYPAARNCRLGRG